MSLKKTWAGWVWAVIVSFLSPGNPAVNAATLTFSFNLDEPSKTSAAVYTEDDRLVRTLWSKVRYPAGTNSANWNGVDDEGQIAPEGTYKIKLLQHNVEYVWNGAIGNTSADMAGPTVHRGFLFMQDMTVIGTNAFYVSGYNEGQYPFRNFLTSDPQRVKANFFWAYDQFGNLGSNPVNIYDRNWLCAAADDEWVYFACSATYNGTNLLNNDFPGCIVASNVKDNSLARFTNGIGITNGPGFGSGPFPNGIYIGKKPGLSGLSVQRQGNLLAAAVGADDRVYLREKRSGAALRDFAVPAAGRLDFASDGTLWVISGKELLGYTNLNATPGVALRITGFSKPLDVAVNPQNPDLILVADGGNSQQVKAFNRQGRSLWTYGLEGGYQKNGIAVATNKFWFSADGVEQTFVTFAEDGSFWVGDEANYRVMHFSAAREYLEQIMYQPHSYVASVDQNDSSRVFNQFLEFKVDYSKPLASSWELVNNWKVGVDTNHIAWMEGLNDVTTFPNGRTYALIENLAFRNKAQNYLQELCELGTNGLRFTGLFPMTNAANRWNSLAADGSARAVPVGRAQWYQASLKGFTNGNPVWEEETLLASAPEGAKDPIPRGHSFGIIRPGISSSDILVSFDSSKNDGWHLGGVRKGESKWLWKTSPAGDLNGSGNYEIGNELQYGGNTVQVMDRNIFYGFHGEFFRGQGQASQRMHYYDNGLFVGQFGEAAIYHAANEGALTAAAGNAFCNSVVKTADGDYFLWSNDEAAHGPQRWHVLNAKNIREHVGIGATGSTITLTSAPADFPTGLSATTGLRMIELQWLPVAGAESYTVRYGTANGGPYATVAGSTEKTNLVLRGLKNGQTHYFTVTAVRDGVEGTPSAQLAATPLNTDLPAIFTGAQTYGSQWDVAMNLDSRALTVGKSVYLGADYITGRLNLRERDYYGFGNLAYHDIGSEGYAVFSWGGKGLHAINPASVATIKLGTGWKDVANLKGHFRIDDAYGAPYGINNIANTAPNGLTANPKGTVNITVTDTNYHYLTVISPAYFNVPRNFTLGITTVSNVTAQYQVNESPGRSHIVQFVFKGNITLWAEGTTANGANLQAVFLDQVPLSKASPVMPPSALQVVIPQ